MKTITVNASKAYDVLVGNGLLSSLGQRIRALSGASAVAVISDSHVFPLYGQQVMDSLKSAGFEKLYSFSFPAGEESKCGSTYLQILEFLAENRLTRSDCIIALGGGVVGDITGFAAATFLRGIDYIQVPTTLLAAVDSSVGGKTAIDLTAGKNLAGAFNQPRLVLCDTDCLDTLPEDLFRDGCAEVIKYGILYDPVLFDHLKACGTGFDREAVIARCVELKRDVVNNDEFDRGERQMLNLGHTIGHSVEALSSFTLSHGKAVAIGMAIISRAAAKLSVCSEATTQQILDTIEKFGLPIATDRTADALYQVALSDKKRSGGTVNLIIPQRIGQCCVMPVEIPRLKAVIEAGL